MVVESGHALTRKGGLSMPITPRLTLPEECPLERVCELLAVRHGITAEEARWRLDRIAAFVSISDTELAELILLGETHAG